MPKEHFMGEKKFSPLLGRLFLVDHHADMDIIFYFYLEFGFGLSVSSMSYLGTSKFNV